MDMIRPGSTESSGEHLGMGLCHGGLRERFDRRSMRNPASVNSAVMAASGIRQAVTVEPRLHVSL